MAARFLRPLPTLATLLLLGLRINGVEGGFHIVAISHTSDFDFDSPQVRAVTTFDPFHHEKMSLRLTGPGYNSLPLFELNNG